MRIYEYDEVDPLGVLHLNLLCLDHAFTPERAATLRRLDPRPFPYLGVYAQTEGTVTGQVGVFRLPVVSTAGADEVGGVWAVATHPAYTGRGIASRLLEEAHARMRRAGLRFVTLGTQRYRSAYALYRRLGYEDVISTTSLIARRAMLPHPTGLHAAPAESAGLSLADELFEQAARDYLGFARRHTPFFGALHAQGALAAPDLWIVWRGHEAVGYATASPAKPVARLTNLLVFERIDPVAAVAAVAHELDAPYVWVRVDKPAEYEALRQAGFLAADPGWGVFMVKPLVEEATVDQFRRLYGVTTGRFLLSGLDIT